MGIDHDGPDYVYEQLAAILRERIQSGELPSRSRIPSLTDLVAEFGLAEMTVRKAIDVLAAEGLVIKRPGRGNFVA